MVMAYPNQLFGMTYPNGQTVIPPELPPPYCTNEEDCTNTNNENGTGQYQPL